MILFPFAVLYLLFIFAYGFRGEGRINRPKGAILLMCYFAYMIIIYQQSLVGCSEK